MRRDTLWSAAEALGGAALAFIFRLFVARIISPDDFGIAAMALTVIALLQVIVDLGFSSALIQRSEEQFTPALVNTTFTASLAASLLIAAATAFLVAPVAAGYFAEPAVGPLVSAAALMLLPTPFSSVAVALLMRARRFREMAIIRLVTVVSSIVVASALLWLAPGPWVVVGQAIAASLFSSIGFQLAVDWRYRIAIDRRELRDVCGYGGFVLANDITVAGSANAGVLALGRFGNASDVGLFALATYLVETTRRTLLSILNKVNFVHYAIAQGNNERLREIYIATLAWNCRLIFPVAIAIILVGPALTTGFIGPEWSGMGNALGWLSLAVMLSAAAGSSSTLFKAIGRPGLDFAMYASTSIFILFPAIFVGAMLYGIEGAAAGTAIGKGASLCVRQYMIDRVIGKTAGLAFVIYSRTLLLLVPAVAGWCVAHIFFPEGSWIAESIGTSLGLLLFATIESFKVFPQIRTQFTSALMLRRKTGQNE